MNIQNKYTIQKYYLKNVHYEITKSIQHFNVDHRVLLIIGTVIIL